ncbi:unnamed protein product [Symbiodinium sp. CCMP2592]|nr:unnamed protein product [Symbiodinium sp. CCMP2592]
MDGVPCCFSTSSAGRPAQPSPGHLQCLFCGDLARLEDVLNGPGGKPLVLRMLCAAELASALRSMNEETYEKAMTRLLEVTPELSELDSLVSEQIAEVPPRKAKKTKSAAGVLKIRRVSGISAAGKILVQDADLYDEVEVGDTDTMLLEVLQGFFRAQGADQELRNWRIKALVSGICIDVNAESTPAMLCSEVVLCKKGG